VSLVFGGNLYDRFRSGFPEPAAPFAHLPDRRVYTYADVEAATARFANALTALGVAPGDRVAVQVEKSIEALMLYLGCARAGAVFLPLNTAYTPAEIEYFLGDAEPRVFVCDPSKADALRRVADGAGARLETLGVWTSSDASAGTLADRAMAASPEFATLDRSGKDLAAILYTSGTTGRSKGAMLTHDNLVSNAEALVETWRFTRQDVLLHALPIFHTHGLFVATNTVLASGASMILLPRFDPDAVFAALPRATTMMGVPTFYVRLVEDARLTREATAHMRLFVSGSAPLLAETHRKFEERTGHAILERYGMTETNMNTSNPYEGERVAGTVGFPLPGVSLRITDPETGAEVPRGEIGMIEVKGPNVFVGYWRMPEKTAAEFRADGFFITGDLGKVDERGYVHIVGRGKDLVITGGYNVYPKEVEGEIDALPGVVESAVIGLPHPDFGEGVTAVIVRAKGATLTEADVQKALERRLAKFKLPKRVLFAGDLPRNTMGKVQKNVLRESYKDLYAKSRVA
jgi:malonyl-CoA/methylmalonyl-CoA synthetase